MKTYHIRLTIVVGFILLASAYEGFRALVTPSTPPYRRFSLDHAQIAAVPENARVTQEAQEGWHFETLVFVAPAESVQRWIVASPSLRSRDPDLVDGERLYPCVEAPPPNADPDTPEGDCTTVRIAANGQRVTIHLVIPPGAY